MNHVYKTLYMLYTRSYIHDSCIIYQETTHYEYRGYISLDMDNLYYSPP